MKESVLILTLLLLTFCSTKAQKQDTVYRFFKGAVNKQYSITMELKLVGNQCTGNYYYDKYRKNVAIEGEVQEDNVLILREFDAAGKRTTSFFTGTFSPDWKVVSGGWENKAKGRRFNFDLEAIEYPIGAKYEYRFDDIRRFQELLNYFDLEPSFPFKVYKGIEKKGFYWPKEAKESARKDYQQVIPYRLAKRYIMDQVQLPKEGNFNYFKIKEADYKPHEMHYKSLCCVYRTASHVALLVHFSDDTGWDAYDVSCLLVFDYGGHLLDACKIGKHVDVEYNGRHLVEKSSSSVSNDGTIELRSDQKVVEIGTDNSGEEFYNESTSERHVYYILQPTGRFIRQEVAVAKKKK